MKLHAIIFYIFIGIAASSAIGILLSRNVFRAVLLLLACLLAIAGLYVLAFAEFIAITQILIYAGGVVVLIIFGVMVTTRIEGKALVVTHNNLFIGAVLMLVMLAFLFNFIPGNFESVKSIETSTALADIGANLITEFALPFEVSGLILLAALVGAAVTTSFMKTKKR